MILIVWFVMIISDHFLFPFFFNVQSILHFSLLHVLNAFLVFLKNFFTDLLQLRLQEFSSRILTGASTKTNIDDGSG